MVLSSATNAAQSFQNGISSNLISILTEKTRCFAICVLDRSIEKNA